MTCIQKYKVQTTKLERVGTHSMLVLHIELEKSAELPTTVIMNFYLLAMIYLLYFKGAECEGVI